MQKTTPLSSVGGLSQVLIKILYLSGIKTLEDIASKTRLELKQSVPRLAVRHMVDLGNILQKHKLDFVSDDSIRPDVFFNQRKIFMLWRMGVFTYKQLESLDHGVFTEVIGGPHSAFFRKKKLRELWLKEHGLSILTKPLIPILHLTVKTNQLLTKAKVVSLEQLSKKGEVDLAPILQPGWKSSQPLKPLTRARFIEIRYALYQEGLTWPYRPL